MLIGEDYLTSNAILAATSQDKIVGGPLITYGGGGIPAAFKAAPLSNGTSESATR
ncbi:MAG: hypothetical protein P8P91_04460 [Pseudomonadales bacterium]|nr:hypothetical protein [Pseudomonadales bacterium]